MSLLNSIAKIYVRLVFRETGYFDALKTQRQFNCPDPPRWLAKRTERVEHATRAFWIDRENAGNGVFIYLHGGAYYFGPVKEQWEYLSSICKMTGMAAIQVDYGFAPQKPFPVGLNHIFDLITEMNLPERWFLGGDSSGAGMAVASCFRLREMGRAMPTGLILNSPWVDATLSNPDIDRNKHEDPMMTVERLSNAAAIYASGHDPGDPLISPINGELSGLPRMLVQMGTADLLLADCRKFVEKCRNKNLDITYQEVPDTFHDFMMLSFLPEAKQARKTQAAFLVSK